MNDNDDDYWWRWRVGGVCMWSFYCKWTHATTNFERIFVVISQMSCRTVLLMLIVFCFILIESWIMDLELKKTERSPRKSQKTWLTLAAFANTNASSVWSDSISSWRWSEIQRGSNDLSTNKYKSTRRLVRLGTRVTKASSEGDYYCPWRETRCELPTTFDCQPRKWPKRILGGVCSLILFPQCAHPRPLQSWALPVQWVHPHCSRHCPWTTNDAQWSLGRCAGGCSWRSGFCDSDSRYHWDSRRCFSVWFGIDCLRSWWSWRLLWDPLRDALPKAFEQRCCSPFRPPFVECSRSAFPSYSRSRFVSD